MLQALAALDDATLLTVPWTHRPAAARPVGVVVPGVCVWGGSPIPVVWSVWDLMAP